MLGEGGADVEVVVDLERLVERLELGNVLVAQLDRKQI